MKPATVQEAHVNALAHSRLDSVRGDALREKVFQVVTDRRLVISSSVYYNNVRGTTTISEAANCCGS